MLKDDGTGKNGTFIADVTDPLHPKTVSFVEVPQGSHNQTVHPSGNYLYNSNSDLITSLAAGDRDLRHLRPGARRRPSASWRCPPRPGLGTESHDITFNDDGTRAYSAALSQGVIIDTTRPGAAGDHHAASSTRRSTSGTRRTRSRSPTRAAASASS